MSPDKKRPTTHGSSAARPTGGVEPTSEQLATATSAQVRTRNPKAKKQNSTTEAQASRRAELARQREAEARKARNRRILWIGLGILALTLAIILAAWAYTSAQKNKPVALTPVGAIDGNKGIRMYPGKAKAGAPKLEVYSDYQCPWCKLFEEGIGDELQRLAANGDIDFVVRQVNFLGPGLGNEWSQRPAEAAACAALPEVNKFPEVFKAIYAFQPEKEGAGYSDKIMTADVPAKVGLDGAPLEAYKKCYTGRSMEGFVKAVDSQARVDAPKDAKGQFPGTPTYVVNGKIVDFYTPLYNAQTKTWNTAGVLDVIKKAAG